MKATHILIIALAPQLALAQNLPSQMPDGRASAHLIFDRERKALVLIDGYQIHLDSTRSDIWTWDGRRWTSTVAFGPGSRSLTAAALNSQSGEIIVFAGIGSKTYDSKKSDAWSLRGGTTWKQIEINGIGTRDHHEMVYADHLKKFVVYGGTKESRQNDSVTWLFDGQTFSPMDIPGPGTRYHFAMAYDKHRQRVVLYGGGEESRRSDLWEFDGSQWLEIKHDKSPGNRLWHSMVYDEAREMVIIQGMGSKETWGWDGKNWIKIAEGGPSYQLVALGYDPSRNIIVAYGGSTQNNTLVSELWELDGHQWKKISENGVWQWQDKAYVKIR